MICCTRITDVTAAIPAAASFQPRALQFSAATSIGSRRNRRFGATAGDGTRQGDVPRLAATPRG